MNPLSIIQMMKSGNPQQFMQQIMGNSQIMSNPMMKNTMQMAQNGDIKGIEQMARNLCKERNKFILSQSCCVVTSIALYCIEKSIVIIL